MKGLNEMVIVGIEHRNFTNKEGKEVKFDLVSLLSEIPPGKGEGQTAEVVSCSPDKSAGLSLGEDVEILYNKYGKILRFEYVIA